jgi:hypothetical protein
MYADAIVALISLCDNPSDCALGDNSSIADSKDLP